jgi:hypothetical protein
VTASGVPSAHLGEQSDPQFVMDALLSGAGAFFDHEIPALGPDDNARYVLADLVREMLQGQTGIDFTETSDAELLDGIEYFIFPNLVIWGGYFFPVVYRFRPTGNNPNSSIMEIMIVVPILDEVPLPPDMPLRWLAPDARFSDQPELGLIGSVLSQDQANLASMQRGLQSTSCNSVTLANYQERNIRNFHEHLAKVLDG